MREVFSVPARRPAGVKAFSVLARRPARVKAFSEIVSKPVATWTRFAVTVSSSASATATSFGVIVINLAVIPNSSDSAT